MLVLEQSTSRATQAAHDGERGSLEMVPPPVPSGKRPLVAMAAGLVLVAISLTLVQHLSGGHPAAPAPASSAVTIGGPADVAVQTATYQPGQTSGWHSHTGIHAVMVLSGTITFYDGGCRRQTYGPGETYVGGQETHLATNETAEPVEVAVTYMFPAGRSHTTFHVDAPPPVGCDVR